MGRKFARAGRGAGALVRAFANPLHFQPKSKSNNACRESFRMSELNERLWAVLSERGREAAGLTYEEAAVLVRELRGGGEGANGRKVSGICIVTDRAASFVAPVKVQAKVKRQRAKVKR